VLNSYDSDDHTRELVSNVTLDASAVVNFSWQQSLLKYKGRVGADPELHMQLISAFHDSVVGGHSVVPATLQAQTTLCLEGDEDCSSGLC
jgi:hypothetical protein